MGESPECSTLLAPQPPSNTFKVISAGETESRTNNDSFWSSWTCVLLVAGVATTFGSSLPVGYNIGVINTPAEIIKKFCNDSIHDRHGMELSKQELEILWSSIVSTFIIGGVTGSCLGATVADNIGRKGGILLVNFLSFLASIFFVSSLPANSIELLFLGRLTVGLSSGLATSIVPMYLTEMSPVILRGAMGVLCPLGVTFGVLIGQIMGLDAILGNPNDWHYLLGVYGLLVIVFTPWILYLPESPKYLYVIKDNPELAIQALCKLNKKHLSELTNEIAALEVEAENNSMGDVPAWGMWKVIRSEELRLPLLLVCALQAGQQTSGINAVFYYSTSIFKKAQLTEWEAQLATIAAGVINCAMAIIAIPLMSNCGRRTLALISTATSTVCLLLLCLTINLIDMYEKWMPKLCIAMVLLYVMFYGFGLGPIPYFIGSELFEVGPRPAAMAIGSLCNWGGNFIVGLLFLSLQTAIGAYSFIIFAVSTGALFIFVRMYLPETKGKSAAEVMQMFRRNI